LMPYPKGIAEVQFQPANLYVRMRVHL
jgi:hypothetical protein